MQWKEVQSPVWQNSCQVLINIWRRELRITLDERFGRVDIVVSAAKRSVDQFGTQLCSLVKLADTRSKRC